MSIRYLPTEFSDPVGTARGLLVFSQSVSSPDVPLCRWRDSCQKFHPGWTHMFWDNQAAEELLLERYPWFMDTWRSYPRVVHRGGGLPTHPCCRCSIMRFC